MDKIIYCGTLRIWGQVEQPTSYSVYGRMTITPQKSWCANRLL